MAENNYIDRVEVDGTVYLVKDAEISASATTPKAPGTAAAGTETAYARGDHVHPKEVSDADRAAWNGKADLVNGKVPSSQLPAVDAFTKAETLKAATAALFGKTNAAVPDDILSLLSKSVLAQTVGGDTALTDVLGNKLTVGGLIESGSYVGTGAAGSDNKNSLIFNFVPYMVVIVSNSAGTFYPGTVFIKGQTLSDGIGNNEYSNGSYALSVSWYGKSVSWYHTSSAIRQLNAEGDSFYYFAIGR